MSYYYSLEPSFEASRLQIQKTIMNLEQRLLMRKELDLQVQRQLLEQQNNQKIRKYESAYNIEKNYVGVQKQLQDRLKYLGTLNYRDEMGKNYEKQQLQLDYITRLKALQRQQDLIAQQVALKHRYQFTDLKNNLYDDKYYPLDESGEMLARKYFDGTRALEFNDELKRADTLSDRKVVFSKNKPSFEQTMRLPQRSQFREHSTVKKYLSSAKKYNDKVQSSNSKQTNFIDPSPIKLIQNSSRLNSTAGKAKDLQKLKNQVFEMKQDYANELRRIEQRQVIDESPILQPKGMKRSMSKSTQPTNQFINVPSYLQSRQPSSGERPKSSTKNSRYLSNRQKSSKSLHYLSSSQHPLQHPSQSMEVRIRREVQNRLRMSQQSKEVLEIFYTKDIPSYLMTICEKEDKFRKELKQKISKIPLVQRKFDVGPVPQ